MREILFRGFHPNESGEQRAFVNGKWTKGYWVTGNLFLPDNPKTPTQICIGTSTVRISYDVIPETVGQRTGLQDKNGKKIVEGDVVRYRKNSPCKIEYINCQFAMMWEKNYRDFEDVYDHNVEVIGNIFENPELLKGGEE